MENNTVYRLTDSSVVNNVLRTIGLHRIRLECSRKEIEFPKRLDSVYLEQSLGHNSLISLKYRFRGEYHPTIMVLDDSIPLPVSGWQRIRNL